MNKLPRRPRARLVGAPPYILACHDFGELPPGHHNERYTICLTAPILKLGPRAQVPTLIFTDRQNLSSWGHLSDPVDRQGCGKLVSWQELPEGLRDRVFVLIDNMAPLVTASWEANCNGEPAYMLGAAHGYGYCGSPEGYKTKTAAQEYCRLNDLVLVETTDPCVTEYRRWFEKTHGVGEYS